MSNALIVRAGFFRAPRRTPSLLDYSMAVVRELTSAIICDCTIRSLALRDSRRRRLHDSSQFDRSGALRNSCMFVQVVQKRQRVNQGALRDVALHELTVRVW